MLRQLRAFRDKLSKIKKWLTNKPGQMKYVYAWYYSHARVKPDRVLFESFHGKDVSDSPYYIYKALEELGRADRYEIYFSTSSMEKHRREIRDLNMKVRLVDVDSFAYTRILATSKYLINNSSFPAYFIRREDQRYLQTWHGTPLKTLGKQMRYGIESMYNVQHNFLQADYIMFPNDFTRNVMMRDYNLNDLFTGRTVLSGYPRNTIFSHPEKAAEVRAALGNDNITTLAYMPTWRGQSNHSIELTSYGREINDMLAKIDARLTDRQRMYVNFHPIVQKAVTLDSYRHILPFPAGVDKYEFLNSVDALITDYSSVFFDFSITRKPIILFMYDYDRYMEDRGVYFDIRTLPFRKIYALEDLIDCLSSESFRGDDYSRDTDYTDRFIRYDSAEAGTDMARLIFDGDEGTMPVEDYGHNREKRWTVRWPNDLASIAAMDALARSVRPGDLVVFNKPAFTPKMSAHLHDNYNDAFTYMFLTNSIPRTLIEDLLALRSKKVRGKIHRRNIRRCFPGLNVDQTFRTTYYNGEAGEQFNVGNRPPAADAAISLENDRLIVRLSAGPTASADKAASSPNAVLIAAADCSIAWRRLLTADEKKNRLAEIALRDLANEAELSENTSYTVYLEYQAGDGSRFIKVITDKTRSEAARREAAGREPSGLRWKPVIVRTRLKGKEKDADTALVPCLNQTTDRLTIIVCDPSNVLNTFLKATLTHMRCHGSKLDMDITLPDSDYTVKELRLTLRNDVKDLHHSLPFTGSRKGNLICLRCRADMDDYSLEPLYWDLNVILEKDGISEPVGVNVRGRRRALYMLLNYECRVNGGANVLFPYRKRLAFSYRERTKYDNMSQRLKELGAALVYYPAIPYWKKKRIWLVYEKFCVAAQENGWYFFKYCMDNLPPEERKHIFYILDPASPDWEKTRPYKDQVVRFMSFRYLVYVLAAGLYISPDSRKHLYQWRAKPNIISNRIERRPLLFLQHGVTALKRVHTLFGKGCSSSVSYFVTTSDYEQKIITTYFGYTEEEAPILGFCRWDVLKDTSDPKDRILLIMPTWRMWLEENSDEEFTGSEYYQRYSGLMKSERLKAIQDRCGFRIIFFIHPKLSSLLSQFEVDSRYVELVPFGTRPLNDIIMKSSMLITDYSSVAWDEYYLGKPVLFYQFDTDNYIKAHGGSYMDFETELFGDRFVDEDALIDAIADYASDDFREKDRYREMRPSLFKYRDDRNCARTYEFIISQGF